MQYSFTVLTPIYNRKEFLPALFETLKNQTGRDFQWLVIDDGSSEDSRREIEEFARETGIFAEYYYKENGGKHTALNYSHPYIKSDWVLIFDSDDTLTPDAAETICDKISEYGNRPEIGILSFQCATRDGTPLVEFADAADTVSDHIEYRINGRRPGDCCEVVRTEVLKKYPFPVYENERFMDETHLWLGSADEYKTVYISKAIYVAEYQSDGLTRQGLAMWVKNPLGKMHSQIVGLNPRCCLSFRIKRAMLLIFYGKAAGKTLGEIRRLSGHPVFVGMCTLPGLALCLYWRRYLKDGKN
ncbi:MAG: glycosyltransferase [Candidatus Avispirillum sp.]